MRSWWGYELQDGVRVWWFSAGFYYVGKNCCRRLNWVDSLILIPCIVRVGSSW